MPSDGVLLNPPASLDGGMCSNGRLMSNLGQFGELVLRIRDPEWFDDDGESLPEVRSGWGEEILLSWFERHATLVAELHEVGRPEQYRYPALPPGSELLWELYRLGRLVDILIAPHQPVDDDPALNSGSRSNRGGRVRCRRHRLGPPSARLLALPCLPRTPTIPSSTRSSRSCRLTTLNSLRRSS